MQEMDKELLKKYNITECYVCLWRCDRVIMKKNKRRPKEETPFSLDENERQKKKRKASNEIFIHVGLNFCVAEFKKYLTQQKYRENILAKLNSNSKLKLKLITADAKNKFQVNKKLVRMILQTAMYGLNIQLDNEWDMVKEAIEIAKTEIMFEQARSIKAPRKISRDSRIREVPPKSCTQISECHGNKNKSVVIPSSSVVNEAHPTYVPEQAMEKHPNIENIVKEFFKKLLSRPPIE
ncbi:hypothetical protein TNCV_3889701 [Trichonephila clavipes]|nr:hypothetical protein TNCV_3889701 [Trichonephila clavipes]